MTRTSEEIEREVESARGDLDRTVDALKDKMSPGQLIDELTRGFKGGGGGEMLNNLGAQVRDNPMALAMIGAGMAWLMMGKGDGGGAAPATYRPPEPSSFAPASEGFGAEADGLGASTGRFAETVGETASHLKDSVTGKAEQVIDGLQNLGGQAATVSHDATRSLEAMFQKEPLIFGALGLAVGVALGASLPATAIEDKSFGAARDDLLKAGEAQLAAAGDKLRASGTAALDAVKEEADQQGLTSSQGQASLVEKAEAVVRSGVDAARDELSGGHPA